MDTLAKAGVRQDWGRIKMMVKAAYHDTKRPYVGSLANTKADLLLRAAPELIPDQQRSHAAFWVEVFLTVQEHNVVLISDLNFGDLHETLVIHIVINNDIIRFKV